MSVQKKGGGGNVAVCCCSPWRSSVKVHLGKAVQTARSRENEHLKISSNNWPLNMVDVLCNLKSITVNGLNPGVSVVC